VREATAELGKSRAARKAAKRPRSEAKPSEAWAPAKASARAKTISADDGRLARGRRSRARIRTAARELFRERGFDGTTLRAIGERAGMGASSIYRHVRSKHELLVLELAELQEEAWLRFRSADDKSAPTRARVQRFLEVQHELLASDADLVVIALRATTYPEAPVARRALTLQDRAIGLLTEILQSGRRDLAPGVDALAAGRALFHVASGARISWANGLLSEAVCRRAIDESVDLLFRGLSPAPG
jgi:TetR/AcrR family transcriptional regulator, cholesterol catabolism regulator